MNSGPFDAGRLQALVKNPIIFLKEQLQPNDRRISNVFVCDSCGTKDLKIFIKCYAYPDIDVCFACYKREQEKMVDVDTLASANEFWRSMRERQPTEAQIQEFENNKKKRKFICATQK